MGLFGTLFIAGASFTTGYLSAKINIGKNITDDLLSEEEIKSLKNMYENYVLVKNKITNVVVDIKNSLN